MARRVAERMDARLVELGERCVLNPPAWAGRLGPIPTGGDDLDVWKRRAGLVAGWMEMHMTDRPDGLLGIVPTASRPEVIGLFRSASDALTGADLTVVAELERAAANEVLRDVVGPASADLYVARSRLSGMRGEDDAGLAVAVQAGNAARYQLPPDVSGQIREAVIALESADRLLARVDPADTRTRDRAVLAQTNAQGRVTDLEGRQILRQQALEGVAHLVDDGIEAMAEVTRRAGISTTEAWSVRPDWLFPLLDERSAERDELVHDLFVWRGRWGAVNDGSMWGATGFPDPSAVRAREAEREALVERVDPIWQRLSTAAVREYEDARTRHI